MAAGLSACMHAAPPPLSDFAARETSQAAQVRHDRMRAISAKRDLPIPRDFRRIVDAGIRADWPAVSNAYARVWPRSHPYENTRSDPRLTTELWNPAHETYWIAYYLAEGWTPELAQGYAAALLDNLPSNSVVLAGSDASRFVAAPLAENGRRPDLFFLSPNALADSLYMDYLEDVYEGRLWIPNPEQRLSAFKRLIDDVKTGRHATAHIRPEEAHFGIDGTGGLMEINAMLADEVFRMNRTTHRFFLDEGFPLFRLYPHLKPHGLLLEWHPEPVESLSGEEAAADAAYWDRMEEQLFATSGFRECRSARMAYAILRASFARLYVHHRMESAAENAFQQAMRLAPQACQAHHDYAYFMLIPRGEIDQAIGILEQLVETYPGAREYQEPLDRLKAERP